MQRWLWVLVIATSGWMLACDDGETDAPLEPDSMVRDIDGAIDEGGEPEPDPGADAEPEPEPEPEADMGLIRDLETCEDICGVYEGCERLDLWADDAEECLRACADAQLSDGFDGYLACVQITACGELESCVVPARPRPMCTEVCEVVEGCGAGERVPQGLPGVASCAAACNDRLLAQTIVDCGEELIYEPEACDEETFARCFLEVRQRDCLELCDRRAGCEEGLDPIDCTLECARPEEVDDPVAERRQTIARTCAREARDCDELAACGRQVARPIVGEATVEALCAANAPCGFFEVEACVESAPPLLRRLADGAIDCLTSGLTESCEVAPLQCFEPATLPVEACDEYCVTAALCGTLPGGQLEFECAQSCRAALSTGDPTLIEPYRPLLTCAFGDTCADIAACVEGAGAEIDCGAYCEARDGCGLPGGEECAADCAARGATARAFAERLCTLATAPGGCDYVERCQAPPPPDCEALCAPLEACGVDPAECVAACDNAHFVDPDSYLPTLACVAANARCDGRQACFDGELAAGAPCLSWCRRAIECQGAEISPEACVLACGDGLGGAEGLVFDGARDCLAEAGPDAACEALDACVDAVPVDGYCEAFCTATVGCRLDDELAACIGDCRANAEDAEQIDQASCALAASRAGAGCAEVAACIGAELEPASPACQDLCAARNACDEDVDVFLCERDCVPEPAGTPVRAACAARAECPELQLCLDAPADPPAVCADACATLSMCPDAIGAGADARYADVDTCVIDCGGAEALYGEGYAADLAVCLDGAACDAAAVEACFEVSPNYTCQDAWDAFVACGNEALLALGDEMLYLMTCADALMNDPTTQDKINCVVEAADRAMGDPAICGEQFGCVLGI